MAGPLDCSPPNRTETFKLSSELNFVAKVRDVVGLYVSPRDHAIILCVDEKTKIQALDRSQPMLLMRPGQPARRTHDYKRHAPYRCSPPSTSPPDASLANATDGTVPPSSKVSRRDRGIEAAVPRELDVHLVMDNYATHKTPLIRRWLVRRPRWHVHLAQTSSSWLNQVERFFALLISKMITGMSYHVCGDQRGRA
ncbi:hypothetical protein GCM10007857_88960 [Bradyrhizobium iriomotense]|uniref:Tc1-like transposase DDE domain-containing protein n=1 Tax=Bradyrhizobium iriomotense TaxID=441950 RepID=A0ABQ6BF67_9BRAD|nr:hypothetical protein GCM10007857_88960 [Bradyrhizobium iriomotense]